MKRKKGPQAGTREAWSKRLKNPERHLEVRFTSPKGDDGSTWAQGWYVFVRYRSQTGRGYYPNDFKAILLRFRRKLDADIARLSLLQQGLVTYNRLKHEPAVNVLRIMTENLQW